jgi:hypothetical protein
MRASVRSSLAYRPPASLPTMTFTRRDLGAPSNSVSMP